MKLAKFVANLKFENLPKNVINEAKKALLDFLGVALAGSKTEIARKVVDLISSRSYHHASSYVRG